MRKIKFIIEEKDNEKSIRDFLREFGVSSSLLTKLKQTENGIMKNGVFAKSIEKLSTGDTLEITIIDSGKLPVPLDFPLDIAFEDDDVLVVNKPPFMPVHESRNHIGDTLSNAVSNYIKEDMSFRAVFRLDRDTSGLVLIAKNEFSAAKLAGKIKKDYYAIVGGNTEDFGTINAPIARVDDSIIKRTVSKNGETAITHFEKISQKDGNTLLKINLETGRTHQIRVHFSNIGLPLLGDSLYGGDTSKINRQALHCKTIYFNQPVTNEKITVTCDFPQDFKGLI